MRARSAVAGLSVQACRAARRASLAVPRGPPVRDTEALGSPRAAAGATKLRAQFLAVAPAPARQHCG